MSEIGIFYNTEQHSAATHLALRWNRRVRFIVPRKAAAQRACCTTFSPGRLELSLRAIASLPRVFGAVSCIEAEPLASIREVITNEAGLSCCRAGTPGPWSKDTILFLDKTTLDPLYIVKAGAGEAVNVLLQNEAQWLRTLRREPSLIDNIPELLTHRSCAELSFVVGRPIAGVIDPRFGETHIDFLRKLQEYSEQTMWFAESRVYRNMRARLNNLHGMLSDAWLNRFDRGMRAIERALSETPLLVVAAHNDFTQWNIRRIGGVAKVFDWEYADYEQLPLFDPLHFFLLPLGLKRESQARIVRRMLQGLQVCQQQFDSRWTYKPEIQALAYLINLCTLYLWSVSGRSESNPVVQSYGLIIDYLCRDKV
jgi:hypothetical protein